MSKPATVNRREFIKNFMSHCGVTYDVACRIYSTMVSTFEDGVADGSKVTIGRLGALIPTWQEGREVTMGFRRVSGKGYIKARQTYNLDPRIRYRFKVYREWLNTHRLNWYG